MEWAWQQLQQEWSVILQAPLLYFFMLTVGLVVIWALVLKLYRSRIEARDDLLQSYQEKLGLGPFKKKPYSKLKNLDLKNKATELAQGIRAFTALADSQISIDPANFSKFWPLVASRFTNDFKVTSVLLRDEMLSRLPLNSRRAYLKADPKGVLAFIYQNPIHTQSMEMVADDLDNLARILPA